MAGVAHGSRRDTTQRISVDPVSPSTPDAPLVVCFSVRGRPVPAGGKRTMKASIGALFSQPLLSRFRRRCRSARSLARVRQNLPRRRRSGRPTVTIRAGCDSRRSSKSLRPMSVSYRWHGPTTCGPQHRRRRRRRTPTRQLRRRDVVVAAAAVDPALPRARPRRSSSTASCTSVRRTTVSWRSIRPPARRSGYFSSPRATLRRAGSSTGPATRRRRRRLSSARATPGSIRSTPRRASPTKSSATAAASI